MRDIHYIVIHCSATRENQRYTFQQCRADHMSPPRNWRDIGYHFYIEKDGQAYNGRHISEIGAHVAGHNTNSIGICYEGGCDNDMNPKDTRTNDQEASILNVIYDVLKILGEYGQDVSKIIICGHRDFPGVTKACPSFDAKEEYGWITI